MSEKEPQSLTPDDISGFTRQHPSPEYELFVAAADEERSALPTPTWRCTGCNATHDGQLFEAMKWFQQHNHGKCVGHGTVEHSEKPKKRPVK